MIVNDRQKRFVVEYPIDSNGTQAAIRAGYSPKTAAQAAYELLSNPEVLEAIWDRQREIASAAALSVDWVLDQWRQIAIADPTELIRVEVVPCRHCYGINHAYQWTDWEYRTATENAMAHLCNSKCAQPCKKGVPPAPLGGFNYSVEREPNPACPVCEGHGEERIRLADMRRVTGPARRLIAGVKKTKDGIEIKMRDQAEALLNISKFLGMLIERKELSTPDGRPMQVNVTADDFTTDQLAQMLADIQAAEVESM